MSCVLCHFTGLLFNILNSLPNRESKLSKNEERNLTSTRTGVQPDLRTTGCRTRAWSSLLIVFEGTGNTRNQTQDLSFIRQTVSHWAKSLALSHNIELMACSSLSDGTMWWLRPGLYSQVSGSNPASTVWLLASNLISLCLRYLIDKVKLIIQSIWVLFYFIN